MTDEKNPNSTLSRRTLLCYVLPSVSTGLAGCGDPNREGHQNLSSENSTNSVNSRSRYDSDNLQDVVEDVNEIYNKLDQFPITNDSEFIFKASAFEDGFDHRELFDRLDSVQRRLNNSKVDSDLQKSGLLQATDVANNLVRQRVVLHQTIAAGITFEESFGEGEYGRSAQVIQDGISFLSDLKGIRDEIIDQVTQDTAEISLIVTVDVESIRTTQLVLKEILVWTSPAYRGLYQTSQGLQMFVEGSSAFNNERFGSAGRAFHGAKERFRSAEDAFARAQGQGRRLPQMAPFVDGVRCMLPAYQTSSEELQRSMEEFETGNDSRAREISREAIISVSRIANRCY